MPQPKDKIGQTIEVESFIVYGHALGRSAGLRIGRVLSITPVTDEYQIRNRSPWKLRVLGVDDDWASQDPKLCKPGTLYYPSRVVRVSPYDLSNEILALLAPENAPAY